jgi:hypothetical protein
MEHLHVLAEGIDILKHNMTDGEYLTLMNALSQLKNIITNDNNNHRDREIVVENDPYMLEQFLEIRNTLEQEILDFIAENKLPDDFINSSFNIIDSIAYNQLNNTTCNCTDMHFCNNTIQNFIKCKNIQKLILNNPLLCVLYYHQSNTISINEVYNDINKYNLFTFDGTIIKKNHIDKEIVMNHIKGCLNIFTFFNHYTNMQVVCFLHIYYIICNFAFELLNEYEKFRLICYEKIKTELIKHTTISELDELSRKINFNNNIFNIILHNIEELF